MPNNNNDPFEPLTPHYGRSEYNNAVELYFDKQQLLYDIGNIAYVEGDVMPTEDEHERHQVFDIAQGGNLDRVTRVMDLALDRCREMLFPYSKTPIESKEYRTDVPEERDEYVIPLNVPATVSKTTLDYIEKLIHEYLVYTVLIDWLSITDLKNPKAADNWRAKLSDIEADIVGAVRAGFGIRRRTLHPF